MPQVNGVQIQTDEVVTIAAEYQRISADLESLKGQVQGQMGAMRGTWNGMAAQAFDQPMRQLLLALAEASGAVHDVNIGLQATAQEHLARDAHHANTAPKVTIPGGLTRH